jgi:hypothetical protein
MAAAPPWKKRHRQGGSTRLYIARHFWLPIVLDPAKT